MESLNCSVSRENKIKNLRNDDPSEGKDFSSKKNRIKISDFITRHRFSREEAPRRIFLVEGGDISLRI